ncbi:hypothetical protein EDB19DRAFT_1898397 [Suillus lakei]|nr:hypothetical protein EDB19DRAFT_1898397 [Suillus lakei]
MATHALFESASGYAIFDVKLHENIGSRVKAVQDSINDLSKFGKWLLSSNINDISEGILSDHLRSLLELNLSKPKKGSKIVLAVSDANLANAIFENLAIKCDASETSQEVLRGIRFHAPKLLKGLDATDLIKAQLGLGHSYSRAKLKFNVNRVDNMIIQAIALLDQLDKDVNLFAMRIREWYGYHFPELVKLVPDNYQYARIAQFIGDKDTLAEEKLPELATLLEDDSTLAQNILDAARGSMGSSISEIDMLNISAFATRAISIADYRKSLVTYLGEKMNLVAPSLTALLGERIGARLISHAGSLTNLSKYPASTVQILGAEKALFRALKTKGNTPKTPSTKVGYPGFLANKCSIASRIDCYSDNPSAKFGEALRAQVEERLNFFETWRTTDQELLDSLALDLEDDEDEDMDDKPDAEPILPLIEVTPKKDKKKKRSRDDMDVDEADEEPAEKKVKMSKEEKKAMKKAAKAARKAEATAAPDDGTYEKKEKKKDKKDKEKKKSKA